jgi:hypothetical protein
VHRDLKPENIYLCTRGSDKNFVKILDFGIAKLTGDGGQSHKTRTGLVIGTPTYMSPEQCEGKGLIDHRSDVYSLGVVMYELLTGRVPFPGEGFGEILVAHLTKTPDNPSTLNPDITPALEAIVLHAIEKDRNRRFQSMTEFMQAVENPEQHLASYQNLPGYSAAGGAAHSGGTMMLDDSAPQMAAAKALGTGTGPRPTTLSGAASETLGGVDVPKKSKAPLFAVLGGVVLVAGVGGYMALGKGKADPVAPVTPTTTAKAPDKPVDELITVTVNSEPPGATVKRGDNGESGPTPYVMKLKKGSPGFDVAVKLDGYVPQAKAVDTTHDFAMLVTLTSAPKSAPPAAEVPPANAPPAVADTTADKKHHSSSGGHHSSGGSKPAKGEKSGEKPAEDDGMKLLTPKF